MVNPINLVSESSYTSTSKGLMTLFAIGAIKIGLGIEFTGKTIEIPWFPPIEIQLIHHLIYLYWAFVAYAIYRYCLHNKTSFSFLFCEAMAKHFRLGFLAKQFIYRYILDSHEAYSITYNYEEHNSKCYFSICSYQDEYCTESFELIFSDSFFINKAKSNISVPNGKEQKCITDENIQALWGTPYPKNQQDKFEKLNYQIYFEFIKSKRLRFYLFLLTLFYSFKFMFKSSKCFDVFLPLLLNVSLFIFWLNK